MDLEFVGFGGVDECRKCGKDSHVYEWNTPTGAVHFYCPICKALPVKVEQ